MYHAAKRNVASDVQHDFHFGGENIIIIFIRTRSTQHKQIMQKIDGTVQQILKIKGE